MSPFAVEADGDLVRVQLRTEQTLLTVEQVEELHTLLERAASEVKVARRIAGR